VNFEVMNLSIASLFLICLRWTWISWRATSTWISAALICRPICSESPVARVFCSSQSWARRSQPPSVAASELWNEAISDSALNAPDRPLTMLPSWIPP
jgi:hypothetical protein